MLLQWKYDATFRDATGDMMRRAHDVTGSENTHGCGKSERGFSHQDHSRAWGLGNQAKEGKFWGGRKVRRNKRRCRVRWNSITCKLWGVRTRPS